jgi:hypothetical protein
MFAIWAVLFWPSGTSNAAHKTVASHRAECPARTGWRDPWCSRRSGPSRLPVWPPDVGRTHGTSLWSPPERRGGSKAVANVCGVSISVLWHQHLQWLSAYINERMMGKSLPSRRKAWKGENETGSASKEEGARMSQTVLCSSYVVRKSKIVPVLNNWASLHEDVWGSGGIAPPLHKMEVSDYPYVPVALPQGKCPLVQLHSRLNGPQTRSALCGVEKHLLTLPGIETAVSDP